MAFFRAFNCRILYGLYPNSHTYCYLVFHHPLTLERKSEWVMEYQITVKYDCWDKDRIGFYS